MNTSILLTLQKHINAFSDRIGQLTGWLTVLMMILMVTIVILRYGFDLGWIAMQETLIYLHSAVFMLGAAFTLKEDEHVRVDIFYRQFSESKKAAVNLFGTLVLLLPVCVFVYILSWDYVAMSWSIAEKSKDAGGLPFVYILKSLILTFAALLVIQAISELCKNTLTIINFKSKNNKDEV